MLHSRVIGDDSHIATVEIGIEMCDSPYHSQSLQFSDAVVLFSRVESPTRIGDWVQSTICLLLGEDSS